MGCREVVVVIVIAAFGQRVVHDLVETVVGQIVTDHILETLRVRFDTISQAAVETFVEIDVIVAVDAHNFLDDIAFAIDVHLTGGYAQTHALVILAGNVDVERGERRADCIVGDLLADEIGHTLEVDIDHSLFDRLGIEVDNVTTDIATGQLTHQECGTTKGPKGDIGVAPTLITE